MSLFAVWLFVRIYCPMSCSISLSDICRNFFTAFSLVFCPIFCPNLWDALFDFFVRPSCPILCPIFCLIFLLDILSHVLFDFVSGYFVRIYMSDFWLVFPSDFLSQFIVRCLLVRSLCVIFCPTVSFDFLSDFCVRFVLSDFFVSFFARYFVRFVFPMSQPLICPWFFILMQIKVIFTRKLEHLASFWKWGFLELGSSLLAQTL